MATGQIKTIASDRGFGFIKADNASEDLFFHSSAVTGTTFESLTVGQTVEFDMGADPRNPSRSRAVNVRVVS